MRNLKCQMRNGDLFLFFFFRDRAEQKAANKADALVGLQALLGAEEKIHGFVFDDFPRFNPFSGGQGQTQDGADGGTDHNPGQDFEEASGDFRFGNH